jgi:hypothetical protein
MLTSAPQTPLRERCNLLRVTKDFQQKSIDRDGIVFRIGGSVLGDALGHAAGPASQFFVKVLHYSLGHCTQFTRNKL